MPLPHTTIELLELLNTRFPARCIKPGESLEEAHRYAGKRELIDTLIMEYRDDDDDHPVLGSSRPGSRSHSR